MEENNKVLFLLYASIIIIITFLQQEYVLIPEFQNLDLIGDEMRMNMLKKWQNWRWVSFFIAPSLMLLRICLVSLCMFVGSFFFSEMVGIKVKCWWDVAMRAQVVLLFYSVVLCAINLATGTNQSLEVTKFTSLLYLGGDSIEHWIKIPLSAVNIFEVAYWFLMAKLVSRKTKTEFGRSFKFVMSSYGVGYLFYIVLLMFLVLYLN